MSARLRLGLSFCALTAGFALAMHAQSVEHATKSVDDWVRLRLETARLETTWQEERSLLEATATALEERATSLSDKRDLTSARTAREREELASLRARFEAEQADVQALGLRLQQLHPRLLQLRHQLPPRVADALEMSFRSLADPALPPAERLQLTMTVLNRCLQFNRSVTLVEDVIVLPGQAQPKSLPVLYWGLSHGYALDRSARQAWLGAPQEGQWRWQAQPTGYAAVQELMTIARDQADPEFVHVPSPALKLVGPTEPR